MRERHSMIGGISPEKLEALGQAAKDRDLLFNTPANMFEYPAGAVRNAWVETCSEASIPRLSVLKSGKRWYLRSVAGKLGGVHRKRTSQRTVSETKALGLLRAIKEHDDRLVTLRNACDEVWQRMCLPGCEPDPSIVVDVGELIHDCVTKFKPRLDATESDEVETYFNWLDSLDEETEDVWMGLSTSAPDGELGVRLASLQRTLVGSGADVDGPGAAASDGGRGLDGLGGSVPGGATIGGSGMAQGVMEGRPQAPKRGAGAGAGAGAGCHSTVDGLSGGGKRARVDSGAGGGVGDEAPDACHGRGVGDHKEVDVAVPGTGRATGVGTGDVGEPPAGVKAESSDVMALVAGVFMPWAAEWDAVYEETCADDSGPPV